MSIRKLSILTLLTMAFAMVSISACSSGSDDGGGGDVNVEITLSQNTLQFAKTGGSADLYVQSPQAPTRVSTDASWLKVTQQTSSSNRTYKYTITADPNTANDDRSAVVDVVVGNIGKSVSVTQTSTEGLVITSSKSIDMTADGGEVTVTLKANGSYTSAISSSWITENTSRANMQEYTHQFKVDANVGATRTATISFTMAVSGGTSITEAVTVNQAEGKQNADMSKTAMEIAALMYPGWKLGNTMEGGNSSNNWTNKGGVSAETLWQNTKTTQSIIDYVASQGFKSVRIPCAWVMGHITDASNCTIDEAWMSRVQEVVDYCIKSGLYVVLNDHWDGGWIEHDGLSTDADVDATKDKLAKIWKQIAEHFKNYDEHLIFAGMNEPGVGSGNGTLLGLADLSSRIAEYEQTFIETVRATGGNNAQRVLVVQGPKTNIDNTVQYNYMSKLKDSATDRLMMEVHFYDPYQFCGMTEDANWGKMWYYWGNGNSGDADRTANNYTESYVKAQMAKMKENFVDKGFPVLIGEYGANQRWNPDTDAKHNASIKAYYAAVTQYAIENGCVPMVWDTNNCSYPSMTVVNRSAISIFNNYMMTGIKEGASAATFAK